MNLINAEILLTVMEVGRVVRSSEKIIERIPYFYYERKDYSLPNPSPILSTRAKVGHGMVETLRPFIPGKCSRKIHLSNEFVKHAISNDGSIFSLKKQWKNMDTIKRLEAHLNDLANGQKYSYDIID